ncbi:hypothetical protein ACHAWC_008448 [Mediolabrus comicus]
MTEMISDLATKLADSFDTTQLAGPQDDSNNTAAATSLPTAAQIYRTGRVLYHYTNHRIVSKSSSSSSSNSNASNSNELIDGFDELLSTIPKFYLSSVILHDINYAYGELVFTYASSSSSSSSPSSSSNDVIISSIGSMLPLRAHANKLSSPLYTLEDVMEGTESICGIYLSRIACGALATVKSDNEEGQDNDNNVGADNNGINGQLELVFLSLSWVYDYLLSTDNTKVDVDNMKDCILKALSSLLRIGLVENYSQVSDDDEEDDNHDEQLTNIMNVIENIQSSLGEYNCALGDMLDRERQEEISFVNTLSSTFTSRDSSQPAQLQYLLSMLKSSSRSSDDVKPSAVPSTALTLDESNIQPLKKKQQTMVDIQIDHIKSILPSLGDGYIEEALKCYNHDIGRTLEALLQFTEESGSGGTAYNNIHPRLRTLPKNLPRQLKNTVDHYTANVDLHRGATTKEDGREHAQRQKERIRAEERKAEEEALLVENVSRALGGLKVSGDNDNDDDDDDDDDDYFQSNRNEYDDDYDDQYDGIGNDGGIGMDEGLYDVDTHNITQKYDRGGAKNEQEMWRKYNRLIKDGDRQSAGVENIGGGGTEEKKYRGPDKGKKGRLIGPDGKYLPVKRGGKKAYPGGNPGRGGDNAGKGSGRGGGKVSGRGAGKPPQGGAKSEDGDEMSKIQKRRKNDNKAKIGNHHRKDRATKKAAGGMM